MSKLSFFFKSIGFQIPLIIAFHFSLIAGVLIFGLIQGYKISSQRSEQYARLLGMSVVNHQISISEEAISVLENWAQSVETLDQREALDICSVPIIKFLADVKDRYLIYAAIDSDYNIICAQDPFESTNVAHREYIKKAFEEKRFTTSGYQIGVVTGKPSLNFGYPVFDESGNATRVLVLALGLDWLRELVGAMPLPEFSEVTIIDQHGLILTSYPNEGEYLGDPLFSAGTFQAITSGEEDVLEFKGKDGKNRTYTIEPLHITNQDTADAYVVVGLPKDILLDDVDDLRNKTVSLIFLTFLVELVVVAVYSLKTPKSTKI